MPPCATAPVQQQQLLLPNWQSGLAACCKQRRKVQETTVTIVLFVANVIIVWPQMENVMTTVTYKRE